MLENKSTRRPRKPATVAKKADPKVVIESAPVGGNGEVSPSEAAQATGLFDTIPDLVKTLVENIRHNTELLKQIDGRRADQTEERLATVEQLRTILNYKAIGQMTGRSGNPFQGNLISARRIFFVDNTGRVDKLFFRKSQLPDGAKVSVQVDGVPTAEVIPVTSENATETSATLPDAVVLKDIGRIEILNDDKPIRLGPRVVATTQD
jgi:hypothetical protein